MRVLHLPTSVGGNAWNLAQAEKSHGIESKVLVTSSNIYSNTYDILYPHTNIFQRIGKGVLFFLFQSTKYDVFHYNFGSTLMPYPFMKLELSYLKLKKKKIFVTFQGSDARLAKYSLDNYPITYFSQTDKDENRKRDKRIIRKVKIFDTYADQLFTTNPDLCNTLPKRTVFRPYTKIQVEQWSPRYSSYDKEKLRIVHAPTSRLKKGTDLIIATINKLIADGESIEFTLVEHMSNQEAINVYKNADLVIDQIMVGWYGGLAVECMALGKPVMVYIREEDMKFIPREMAEDMPVIRTSPDYLYDDLKLWIHSREELKKLSVKSRRYVEKWHDSKKIALDIIKYYKEKI